MTSGAVIATARFGLGARPGELALARSDPRGWLAAQLATPAAELVGLPPGGIAPQLMMAAKRAGDPDQARAVRRSMRELYRREVAARTRLQASTSTPLRERLVGFWANHFTVSVQRPTVSGLAGAFEREAIRPHLAGSFHGLLHAVVRHPAMLLYLDNARSIGPRSRVGQRRSKGLNENLARECLELHTLGVDGGYTQRDVTEFAKILTGWSVDEAGEFTFRPGAHEPGGKMLLGRHYAEAGEAEGEAALAAIARHPATARHVANQLARHFVADAPPAALTVRLARRFTATDGDLNALVSELIAAPEAWRAPAAKLRTPQDLVIAASRALDRVPGDDEVLGGLTAMGQAPWRAPSPQGWPDIAAAWAGPEALMQRAEWAQVVAARAGPDRDARAVLATTLGAFASTATREAVDHAGSRRDAMTLLLASPEFQWR